MIRYIVTVFYKVNPGFSLIHKFYDGMHLYLAVLALLKRRRKEKMILQAGLSLTRCLIQVHFGTIDRCCIVFHAVTERKPGAVKNISLIVTTKYTAVAFHIVQAVTAKLTANAVLTKGKWSRAKVYRYRSSE